MNCIQTISYVPLSKGSLIMPITSKAKGKICMVTIFIYIGLLTRMTTNVRALFKVFTTVTGRALN
jgi:hypothetical protein